MQNVKERANMEYTLFSSD